GATPRFHKAEVMAQTSALLEAEEAERHRRVVIVVDEAHLLTPEQLEELRLLTLGRAVDYAEAGGRAGHAQAGSAPRVR
ncbi:MAG: AAA family ATPase, partial [Candidatus Limnocylindrales bacterium]